MAEEVEQDSTGKQFKGILITLVSTVTLGVGGFVTNKLTGGGDKDEKPAVTQPAIIINNSQQQAAGGTKTVVVKEKAVEAKPAPKKKEFSEEPKWQY